MLSTLLTLHLRYTAPWRSKLRPSLNLRSATYDAGACFHRCGPWVMARSLELTARTRPSHASAASTRFAVAPGGRPHDPYWYAARAHVASTHTL